MMMRKSSSLLGLIEMHFNWLYLNDILNEQVLDDDDECRMVN